MGEPETLLERWRAHQRAQVAMELERRCMGCPEDDLFVAGSKRALEAYARGEDGLAEAELEKLERMVEDGS